MEEQTVYRPLGARVVALAALACLLAILAVTWVALPDEVTDGVSALQRVTLSLFVLGCTAVLVGIARSSVRTDVHGIHVVNGYRRHDLEWAEAVRVSLGRGAPWAVLDTADGSTVSLMAIQGADGDRARLAVRRLRASIDAHGAADPRG